MFAPVEIIFGEAWKQEAENWMKLYLFPTRPCVHFAKSEHMISDDEDLDVFDAITGTFHCTIESQFVFNKRDGMDL
jgi:hypothetical protein